MDEKIIEPSWDNRMPACAGYSHLLMSFFLCESWCHWARVFPLYEGRYENFSFLSFCVLCFYMVHYWGGGWEGFVCGLPSCCSGVDVSRTTTLLRLGNNHLTMFYGPPINNNCASHLTLLSSSVRDIAVQIDFRILLTPINLSTTSSEHWDS